MSAFTDRNSISTKGKSTQRVTSRTFHTSTHLRTMDDDENTIMINYTKRSLIKRSSIRKVMYSSTEGLCSSEDVKLIDTKNIQHFDTVGLSSEL